MNISFLLTKHTFFVVDLKKQRFYPYNLLFEQI